MPGVIFSFISQEIAAYLAACGKLLFLYELGCKVCAPAAVFDCGDLSKWDRDGSGTDRRAAKGCGCHQFCVEYRGALFL